MSEENDLAQQPDGFDLSRLESGDPFIGFLVNVAEKTGREIGVTFSVGGFLVSGYLVPSDQYGKGVSADLGWGEALDQLFPEWTDEDKEESNVFALREFVHLKNAKFFSTTGRPIPNNRGVWWRARINQISGVNVGVLSVSTD